jgi:Xaa-Pro dipeptidase
MSAFEQSEYRDRVQQVSAAMQKSGVDTLVVLAEANIFYLSGYEGFSDYVPQAAVLRAGDQDVTLILREMDIHCAYPTVYLDESRVEWYPESLIGTPERSPWEVIGARVKEIAQGGTIGVDYMRQAAVIVDNALQKGIAQIAEGVRECDVAATILHQLTAGTAQCGGGPTKPPTMGVGTRAAAPHLKWTDAPYAAGAQTDFEIGGYVHRYACPLSRTAYLGDPPQRLLDVHSAVLDGFLSAEAAIRPGGTCGDVHRGFAEAFYPHGVRKESRIGYSVGIDWSDLCFSLQGDDATVLEVDYTFHLIIGVWEKADAYVFSEAFRVGPNGGESFSKTPRQLFVR